MTTIDKVNLHAKIAAAGIPIDGIGRNPDDSIRIDFKPEATNNQKTQAAAIVASYDQAAEDAASAAIEASKQADISEIKGAKLQNALDALAIHQSKLETTHTNAEILAAVLYLVKVMIVLVKAVARLV